MSLALLEVMDFPFSLFLSLPSMSDPAAAAVEGNLGGNVEFSRHSPWCDIFQTFPLSLPSPGICTATGGDPSWLIPVPGVPGGFPW